MEHEGQNNTIKRASDIYDALSELLKSHFDYRLTEHDISLSGSSALSLQGFPRLPKDMDFFVADIQVFGLMVAAMREASSIELSDTVGHTHARAALLGAPFDLIVAPVSTNGKVISTDRGQFIVEPASKLIAESLYHCQNSIPAKLAVDIVHFLTESGTKNPLQHIDPDKDLVILDALSDLSSGDDKVLRAKTMIEKRER